MQAWHRYHLIAVCIFACARRTMDEVDAFYAAAMAAGGVSESAPSLRPHDRVRYYATFIADADGNRIEVVTFPKDDATTS